MSAPGVVWQKKSENSKTCVESLGKDPELRGESESGNLQEVCCTHLKSVQQCSCPEVRDAAVLSVSSARCGPPGRLGVRACSIEHGPIQCLLEQGEGPGRELFLPRFCWGAGSTHDV